MNFSNNSKKKNRTVRRAIVIIIVVLALFIGYFGVTSILKHNNKTNEPQTSSQSNTTNNSSASTENKTTTETKQAVNSDGLPALSTVKTEADQKSYSAKLKEINNKMTAEGTSNAKPYIVNGIILANKTHPLPSSYAPGESKEARAAFDKMAAAAQKEGINITAFSTYRSYDYQKKLYDGYVSSSSKEEADKYSARPGFSEHQTGLGFDIGGEDHTLWAENGFKNTKEAKWLKENATKYGFILRFPDGKDWVTGYLFESWHYRYVGLDIAKKFEGKEGYTLEEYLESQQ